MSVGFKKSPLRMGRGMFRPHGVILVAYQMEHPPNPLHKGEDKNHFKINTSKPVQHPFRIPTCHPWQCLRTQSMPCCKVGH